MKTEKKRNLEKLKRLLCILAFMYLCKPIASAQNPPVIKKRKKWAPQSPRYNSNTAGEYPCKHCTFFLNVNTCEREVSKTKFWPCV